MEARANVVQPMQSARSRYYDPSRRSFYHDSERDGVGNSAGADCRQQVGSVQLAMFANPGGLEQIAEHVSLDDCFWRSDSLARGRSEGLVPFNRVLEQSNVSVVDEFIQMILAQALI